MELCTSRHRRGAAWAAIAFILIVDESYGGSGVFRVLDPFLTARMPAEAMTITALGCYVRGKTPRLSLAMGAIFIHPLIALPGLLFIVCLWTPLRVGVIGALGGVLATLAIAIVSVEMAPASHVLTVMDAPWLEVVRETFAIPVFTALVTSRSGHQRSTVHLCRFHGNCSDGGTDTQAMRCGCARWRGRIGGSANRGA